jgi:hypothetical protein
MSKDRDEGLKDDEVLSSQDRIRLCKLACDTYDWGEDSKFNSNNMLILDVADSDPKTSLLYKIVKILDASTAYKDKKKEKDIIKTRHLFYLCGSDFFIKKYLDISRYSIIYVVRMSDEGQIKEKLEVVKSFSNTKYLKIGIDGEGSEVYSLPSTTVRDKILSLKSSETADKSKIQDDIIQSIGLPVYCYLRDLQYLIGVKFYGKKCASIGDDLSEEIESVHDSEISEYGDTDDEDDDDDDDDDDEGAHHYIELSDDDIPEKNKNIFIDINTFVVFDSQSINDEYKFNKLMDDLISCDGHDKENVDLKQIKNFLIYIYNTKLYYILNDLCYFKKYKIDRRRCFIQDLFSPKNTEYIKDIQLISKEEFDRVYLSGDGEKAVEITSQKEDFLNNIGLNNYTDYHGKRIDEETANDILGFLYESERYSIYLNLINPYSSFDTINIILSLYSTVIKQKNDKVESIVDGLNKTLTSTISSSKGKESKDPKGSKELLKAVNYVNYSTNADGNCFYNSVGMLSSEYLRTREKFEEYKIMSIEEKNKIQFNEQSRVRTELSNFMIKIYEIINGVVDRNSELYKNSTTIKYIIENGDRKNKFKYVRTIKNYVGEKYYGGDDEIYFASLYYKRPIITVTGISDVTTFNVLHCKDYNIDNTDFSTYINNSNPDKEKVLKFINDYHTMEFYSLDNISNFIVNYPYSYFLVGGRGHWSYAVNEKLLFDDVEGIGGGGNNKYNIRVTKKVKNKYYQKSSTVKGTKKRKMTKKHMKSKEYKKGKKKTIKHM